MNSLADLSIRAKLGLVILVVTLVALGLTAAGGAWREVQEYGESATRELTELGALVGNRSTAALVFDDRETAQENLRALGALEQVRRACLYDANGALFAAWREAPVPDCGQRLGTAPAVDADGDDGFSVIVPIRIGDEQVGSIAVAASLAPLRERLWQSLVVDIVITLFAALLAAALAWWIARLITVPLLRVRDAAIAVAEGGDAARRAPVMGADEVGQLAQAFNRMLDTLGNQRRQLEDSATYTRVLFDDSRIALVVLDPQTGCVIDCNEAAVAAYGLPSREVALGLGVAELSEPVQPDGSDSMSVARRRIEAAVRGEVQVFEWRHRRPDGTSWDGEVHLMPFLIGDRVLLQFSLQDITQRKAAEAALRASEERLRNIAGNLPGAILREVHPESGAQAIDYISPGCRLLWEIEPEQAIRDPGLLVRMVHPDDVAALSGSLLTSRRRLERWTCQWRIRTPSGGLRWLQGAGQPLRRADGLVVMDSVVFDVSERVLAADALARLNADLEQRNRELQQLLSVASHDLQEPLRKIEVFVDRLHSGLAGRAAPVDLDRMERIRRAAGRMRDLVDDVLGYSALAREELVRATVPLSDPVAEALEDLEAAVAESGATIEVGPLPNVLGNARELRRLFLNLVGNSIKYRAPERPLRVSIHAQCDATHVRVRVRDNGIGFDNAHAERIFAAFLRLHGAAEYGGTGIGLAIVRKIAERHGGSVHASGEPGVGAEFVVTLPLPAPGAGR